MGPRRIIALTAGAVVTVITFIVIMGLLIFGGIIAEDRIILCASFALGPVAMFSVMLGYAVWWMILFLLSLFLPEETHNNGI
jgi:hypothetical protein